MEYRKLTVDGLHYISHGPASLLIKRVFDIAVVLGGLVIAAPLLLVIAVLIKLDTRGPVFFRQSRVGLHRRRLLMWKFRKMYEGLPRQGPALTTRYDPRLTRMGSLLERTKLDELPQLINVLLGDMSIIGPRPEVPKFVEHYPERWDEVLSVKPGVFGPNQVLHRNEPEMYPPGCANMEKYYVARILPGKLQVDASYARQTLLLKDCHLLLQGLWAALSGIITWRTVLVRRWQIANLVILTALGVIGTTGAALLENRSGGFFSSEAKATILLAAVVKLLALLLYRVPKGLASSATAQDFLRLFWCGASSSVLLVCALIGAGMRGVSRELIVVDALFFLALLPCYKLVLYKAYLTFRGQESPWTIGRRLIVFSFFAAPCSMATVVTFRHGFGVWMNGGANLYVAMVMLPTAIRPLMVLLGHMRNIANSAEWFLYESPKLIVGSVIGSGLLVAGTMLIDERGIGRGDVLLDTALFALVSVCYGLWSNLEWMRHEKQRDVHGSATLGKLIIVGSGLEVGCYIHSLSAIAEGAYQIAGVVSPSYYDLTNLIAGHKVLGTVEDLPRILDVLSVDKIVILRHSLNDEAVAPLIEAAAARNVESLQVDIMSGLARRPLARIRAANIVAEAPLSSVPYQPGSFHGSSKPLRKRGPFLPCTWRARA